MTENSLQNSVSNNLKSLILSRLLCGGIIIYSFSSIPTCGFTLSDNFNEVILSAIFDPAKSTVAGAILSESCLPASFLIF